MLDIVELQKKLRDLQIEQQHEQQSINTQQYRLRTATIEKEKEEEKERQRPTREREVVGLLNEGYDADQTSYILDIPLSEVARIEEYNQKSGSS